MDDISTQYGLQKRIRDKRRNIKSYIENMEPIGIRLTNLNIICGAIATVFTATPAIGGSAVLDIFSGPNSETNTARILFASAALFSLLSTIAANLYKSREIASRLSRAQASDAKLEGLETLLELKQIELPHAANLYTQYIYEIPFITEDSYNFLRKSAPIDLVKGYISEPKPNERVEKTIISSGRVEGMSKGCHLWLAVEANGFIWPKEREIFVEQDGSWKEYISEEGSSETFSLSLYVANNAANKHIRSWMDRGDETGNYPELRRVRGTRRLSRVDGLYRNDIK
jgi:hypothetical protein